MKSSVEETFIESQDMDNSYPPKKPAYIRAGIGMIITWCLFWAIRQTKVAFTHDPNNNLRLVNEKPTEISTVLLNKRNKWTIFASKALNNIVVAVGCVAGGWCAQHCPPMSLGCWVATAIVLVAAVAQTAISTH